MTITEHFSKLYRRENMWENSIDRFALKEITENPIILDFSKCKYLGEIHSLLKEKFGFHDYYGENWDALWDLMQDVFSDDKEYTVELCEFNSLNIELRTECEKMLKIFDRVAQLNFKFSYKIVLKIPL